MGLINRDIKQYQKSITVLLNASKIFTRHHRTLKQFDYGEKNVINSLG